MEVETYDVGVDMFRDLDLVMATDQASGLGSLHGNLAILPPESKFQKLF